MKKILIFGSTGQVGWELHHALAHLGQIIALDRMSADLTQPDMVRGVIRSIKPDIIVNAAAYTAVDKAESEPDCSMIVNGVAPGIMAEEAKRCNAIFVHYSTDYVFDGCSKTPYCEDDTANPINVYGKTKLAGEHAIQEAGGRHLIFRTSWVYGMRGRNFLITMLKLAKEKDKLKIVMDQHGAPTWCRTIAETTRDILSVDQAILEDKWGIYNLTASGSTTWHGFATAIFALKQEQEGKDFRNPHVIGIPSSEFPSPVKRPKYSVLSHHKIYDTFSLHLPAWETALEEAMGNAK
jgi:dTDP-4-dehydrorhamnose reductase